MGSDVTLAPTNIVTFNDENKTAIETFEGLFELYKSKQLKTMLLTYGMNYEVAKSSKYKFDNDLPIFLVQRSYLIVELERSEGGSLTVGSLN